MHIYIVFLLCLVTCVHFKKNAQITDFVFNFGNKHNLKKFGWFSGSIWPVFFETAVVSLHYCTTTTMVHM